MIHPRKLANYVFAEPFRPFRIKMVSGLTLDIRHPEMIEVGKVNARVFITSEDDPSKDHWKDISLMLMETVEPLVEAAPQKTS